MKNIRIILSLVLLITACGTTKNVIVDSGDVYTIKGDAFYQGKNEVTEKLSASEKQNIKTTLNTRIEAEKERDKRKNVLQNRIGELKSQLKELESSLEEIEERERDISHAREAYIESKLNLIAKENKLKKLDKSGNLTEEKRLELESDIIKIRQRALKHKSELDKLRKS